MRVAALLVFVSHDSTIAFEGQFRGPRLKLFCAFKTGMLIIPGSLLGTRTFEYKS